jgi:hypothetical protein
MSFPKASRDDGMLNKDQIMAPPAGKYKIKPKIDPESKRGPTMSPKIESVDKMRLEVPGPGSYNLMSAKLPPGGYIGSVSGKSELEKRKERLMTSGELPFDDEVIYGDKNTGPPGPGSYNLGLSLDKGPFFSMTGKLRTRTYLPLPGPGSYNGQKFLMKSNQSIVFGSEMRSPKDNTSRKVVPGPGSYKINSPSIRGSAVIGDEPRILKPSRSALLVPGPGAYKVSGKLTTISAIMPVEKRFKPLKCFGPGPGAYRIPGTIGYRFA